jgi:hypothetical protein
MSYIRKISVGTDYKNAMHYIVGQSVMGGTYIISEIVSDNEGYGVWIRNDQGESVQWKFFDKIPCVIEFDLDLI